MSNKLVVRSIYKRAHMSPTKVRPIINLVRYKKSSHALDALKLMPHKSAFLVRKTLLSAVANAKNNHNLNPETLYIKEAYVDQGIIMKRFAPVSKGRSHPIKKRTCHITIKLSEI